VASFCPGLASAKWPAVVAVSVVNGVSDGLIGGRDRPDMRLARNRLEMSLQAIEKAQNGAAK